MEWLIGPAAILATIWAMVEMGHHFDKKEDDPKFRAIREKLGHWLTSQNDQSFPARVRQANELFFHWFDALFHGKGTLLEQGLWLGLIFSPVMLLLIRLFLLVAGEQAPESSRMLLFAMVLAFALSTLVVAGRALSAIADRLGVVLSGVLGVVVVVTVVLLGVALGGVLLGVLLGVPYGVPYGVPFGVRFGGLGGALGGGLVVTVVLLGVALGDVLLGVLIGALVAVLVVVLGDRLGGMLVGVLLVGGVLVGVLIGVLVGFSFSQGLTFGLSLALGGALGLIAVQLLKVRLPVHPLRSVALSLVSVCLLSAIMREATASFYYLLLQDGPIVLGYVAFNLFGDAISLLETRWILGFSRNRGLLALPGLVLMDLALSAAIFLFLPLVLGELPSFWENILFRGSRPWLGIFFWSTFSTSVLFYLFVATVVLLIVPGHGVARLFHRTVGGIITIESSPFSAIAWGMSLLLAAAAVISLAGPFLYHLVAG